MFKDGSDIEQYLSLLLGERFLLLRIIEEIDRLGDFEDISLPNTSNYIDLLSKYQHLLAIKLQYADEAAEVVGTKTLVILLLSALVLPDGLAAAIDLEDSWHSVFVEVGHDDKLLSIHPDRYCLQVQLFL